MTQGQSPKEGPIDCNMLAEMSPHSGATPPPQEAYLTLTLINLQSQVKLVLFRTALSKERGGAEQLTLLIWTGDNLLCNATTVYLEV